MLKGSVTIVQEGKKYKVKAHETFYMDGSKTVSYTHLSAIAAEKGGATRLELCQNLIIGGTTPGPKLFEIVRHAVEIPVHVLIRPRFGDFCYSDYEICLLYTSKAVEAGEERAGLPFERLLGKLV